MTDDSTDFRYVDVYHVDCLAGHSWFSLMQFCTGLVTVRLFFEVAEAGFLLCMICRCTKPYPLFFLNGSSKVPTACLATTRDIGLLLPVTSLHLTFPAESERETYKFTKPKDFPGLQVHAAVNDPRTYLWCRIPPEVTSMALMARLPSVLVLLIVLVGLSVDRRGHHFQHYVREVLFINNVAAFIVLMTTTNVGCTLRPATVLHYAHVCPSVPRVSLWLSPY